LVGVGPRKVVHGRLRVGLNSRKGPTKETVFYHIMLAEGVSRFLEDEREKKIVKKASGSKGGLIKEMRGNDWDSGRRPFGIFENAFPIAREKMKVR